MNNRLIALALLLLPVSTALVAETTSEAKMPEPVARPMPPGKGKMMEAMTEEQREQHLIAIQEHQLKMHELSGKILAEPDPGKQEQLKKEQRALMRAHHAQMMAKHAAMKPQPGAGEK